MLHLNFFLLTFLIKKNFQNFRTGEGAGGGSFILRLLNKL